MKTLFATGTVMLLGAAVLFTGQIPDASQSPSTGRPGGASRDGVKPSVASPASAGTRKIPCKTPENASSCYWTHGRLTYGNGNPSLRVWKIGTDRKLGVFNGPSHFPPAAVSDDEDPELPNNLTKAYEVEGRRMKRLTGKDPIWPPLVFADLEICPLRPAKEGSMQPVCIESASKIFVKRNE